MRDSILRQRVSLECGERGGSRRDAATEAGEASSARLEPPEEHGECSWGMV